MATNTGTARDAAAARRRRIAEKGAERLALITGRSQSLSSSLSPPSNQRHIADDNTDSPSALISNETAGDDVVSDEQPIMNDPEIKPEASAETSFEPRDVQSFLNTLTEQKPASFETRDVQSFLDTLTEQNPSSASNKSQQPRPQTRLHKTFSPKLLRPAIKASENTRTYCSIIMSLLVLLSYAGFPILGNNSIKNIILFRPLFLLIVTNITIVVGPILLEKVKLNERRGSSTGEAGFANNIGTILEWGMLTKTGLSALFMDCSIYSVVVVCGLCCMQRFGW